MCQIYLLLGNWGDFVLISVKLYVKTWTVSRYSSYCATIWWNLRETQGKETSQMAMTHSQSTWGHRHVLYVASRMVVGWESRLGTQLSHRDKRFIWSQLQMVVTRSFTPAPEVSSFAFPTPFIAWISTPVLSCTVSPNKSRAANSAQMWWWITVSLCETAEMSPQRRWEQQQVGHAVGRHRGLHAVGRWCFTPSVRERETRIQAPWREAKRFSQRGLKEAGVQSSCCFFACQALQFFTILTIVFS